MLKVGIAGFGTIGKRVARGLDEGIPGMQLVAVTSGDAAKARAAAAHLKGTIEVLTPAELAQRCDIIVECAPSSAFENLVTPALKAGRTVVTVSGAALLRCPQVIDLAKVHGGRIILATGALLGFDAVRA